LYNNDTITTLEIPSITCMSSATGYLKTGNTVVYKDLIICKWEFDGFDYFDSSLSANSSCQKIGYTELFSTGDGNSNIKNFVNTETMRTYIVSSLCTMNER
jgi:hypothetical protein